MDVISLLLPFFMLPGVESLAPVEVFTDGEVVMFDQSVGTGRTAGVGDVVTVHYVLRQEGGKELANSALRGLPFSFAVEGTDEPSPLVLAVQGMRVGGARELVLPGDRLTGFGDAALTKAGQYTLVVRLVAARRVATPKVDSNDARRTEGAMALSRASRQHGPARS